MPIATEDFWEDLLARIEGGNVLPIVGQGVTTMDPDDALLAPWLAVKLAERLSIAPNRLPSSPTLHDVICRHLIDGGKQGDVYTRLFRVLRDQPPEPGLTLRRLASIDGLRLFFSATSDSLLTTALNRVRHDGQAITRVCAYSPGAESKDLPGRKRDLPGSTVFHILGRVSQYPDYVAWEEDLVEFICGLHQHMPVMNNLARELADPNMQVLVLGLNFADWLVRFFLRVVRQSPLSKERPLVDCMAEGPLGSLPESMVMFFGVGEKPGGALKNIQVIPCEPREFVAELARRWTERHPPAQQTFLGAISRRPTQMRRGAIFLSYMREDEEAVRTLMAGLEYYGCTVWYDQQQLRTGQNFAHEIEDEVKRNCSLFISVISRTTESTDEGFAHRERDWAAERAKDMVEVRRAQFYHAVIIDNDLDCQAIKHEPRIFADGYQRTKLVGGQVTPEFGNRLRELQLDYLNQKQV